MSASSNVFRTSFARLTSLLALPKIQSNDIDLFYAYFNDQTIGFLRVTMLITCLLHLILIWSDYLLFPKDFYLLLAYHVYTIVGAILLISISYHPKFIIHAPLITSVVWILSTISVSITVSIMQFGVYFYIVAVVFTFFYSCLFIRMPFAIAALCCCIGLAILNVALFLTGHDKYAYIFSNATMIYATIIGLASCYVMDKLEREKFLLQLRMQHEREKSDELAAWLRQLATFLRHEVRQPIAQINSSVELCALKSRGDLDLKEHLLDATSAAQHVWHLIDRASRATDAEAYVRQSSPEDVDLSQLVAALVDSFRKTHGVGFVLNALAAPRVRADPALVKEAIGNLLSNAASFADEGSVVEVMLAVRDGRAEVTVRNEGPTIDGDAETLFQPFASSRSGASSDHHGLGLYLVRLIAQQHGGTATIANSANGKGVEASLFLPLAT